MESTITFWLNPAILVAIATLLWRSQTRRFDQVDKRFDQVDKRFNQIDQRFDRIDKRFDRADQRSDRIERQLRELTREVAANGKSIARIEGRHQGHPQEMATID